MAINQDRTNHLADLDKELRGFRDAGLSWFDDVSATEADSLVADLVPLYKDVRVGSAYDERKDVYVPDRRSVWIQHPPPVVVQDRPPPPTA